MKTCHSDATASMKQVAYQIRERVKQNCVTQEWPPDSSRLNIDHIVVPPELGTFLQHLFSGDDPGKFYDCTGCHVWSYYREI